MPSVASESHTVLPSRSHSPGPRSHAAERNEPATPFAELLDSTAPAAEPPSTPRPSRSRSERAERDDAPKATGRDTEAKPAKDKANTKDSRASGETDTTKDASASTSTEATDAPQTDKSGNAASVEKVKLDGDIASSTDTDAPQTEADPAAALAALTDAAMPATPQATIAEAKLALATPKTETSDADEFAAMAAASQGPRQGAGTKPADAEATKPGTSAAPTGPDAATADAQSGKNAQSRDHGDKPAEFRHAMADLAQPDSAPAASANDNSGASKASSQAMQHLALTPAMHNSAASAAPANSAVAAAQAQTAPVPLSGLAVEIVSQAHAGNHRFEIRLDPPELGRIDVKLDVDRDGNVSTRLVVDRADTLDLLKRDAATLERALQQAGLKTADHGLDFQLRQHAFAQDDAPHGGSASSAEDEPAPIEAVRQNYGRLLGMGSGLDIRV